MKRLLALACLLFPALVWAQLEEPLEPEKAFAIEARVLDPGTVEVRWTIAKGYYLYRDKIRFEVEGQGVRLGRVDIPRGKKKQDEFFGEVEIFKHELVVRLPLVREDGAARTLTLKAHSQGCNEPIGICYQPLTQTVKLALPPAAAAGAPARTPASLDGLKSLIEGGGGQEFLDPDQAFVLSVQPAGPNRLRAEFTIAEGYYLYRDKTRFQLRGEGVALGTYTLPPGKKKVDEFFGEVEVYYGGFAADLPLERTATGAVPVELVAHYQGCAENGICYPPITRTVALTLPAGGPAPEAAAPQAATAPAAPRSEEEEILALLTDASTLLTLVLFFGFGLLLALTPCVFPMIPILSGIIVGQGRDITRWRAFSLSVIYVLGMAITYTIAGVIAGLTGELLSSAFQNPWVLGAFAAVFVLLALSMFGFYDLQLPAAWQARLSETSNRLRGGAAAGVFVMGVLSALIVGPCVAAPLSGALLYISQTGDVVLGGAALFALSLGMGLPLIAVGTSAGALMPKAGPWMNAVKAVFGVLLLGVAVWMIARVVPPAVTLFLYALLLIIPAIYLRALDPLPPEAGGWSRLWKGTGIVMLIYGLMLLVGAFTGARDPLAPLAPLTQRPAAVSAGPLPAAAPAHALDFQAIKGADGFDAAMAAARGRPVMLDFYADWCIECVRMENTTFRDPRVVAALADYVLLRADVTANDAQDKALLKRFKLFGPPAILFFDRQGREQTAQRLVGYKNADEFLAILAALARGD